jgi:predicted transglutaminase-like cysteine proteinase
MVRSRWVFMSKICFLTAALACAVPASRAQVSGDYRGEAVVSSSGEVVAPWVAKRGCKRATQECTTLIVNPTTNEIAMIGNRMSSRFERTGNGQEVRRAEKALDKARRLSAKPG